MISNTHIASAFDRDLETIQGLIMKMGGMVEEAIENASTALLDSDLDLANATRRGDKAIDALELRVNEEAARLIALPPICGPYCRCFASPPRLNGSGITRRTSRNALKFFRNFIRWRVGLHP